MNCLGARARKLKNGRTKLQDGSVVQLPCVNLAANNSMTGLALMAGFVLRLSLFLRHSMSLKGWAFVPQGVVGKSHSTVIRWERLAQQAASGLPLHQKVLMSPRRRGSIHSCRWEPSPKHLKAGQFTSLNGKVAIGLQRRQEKETSLFEQGTQSAWNWVKQAQFICWFSDGERRYGKALKLASVYLKGEKLGITVARSGARVWSAMKIKGSQGRRRVEWVYAEHPFTAISCASEVHTNHNEAQNSALRRRSPCLSQTTEPLSKRVQGLQRALMCNDWCITGCVLTGAWQKHHSSDNEFLQSSRVNAWTSDSGDFPPPSIKRPV